MKDIIATLVVIAAALFAGIGSSLADSQLTNVVESSSGFGSSNVFSASDSSMTGGNGGYQSTGTVVNNRAGTVGTVTVLDSQSASGVNYPFSAIGISTNNQAGFASTTDMSRQSQTGQKYGTEVSNLRDITLGGVAIENNGQFQFQAGCEGSQYQGKTTNTQGFSFGMSTNTNSQTAFNKKGTDQTIEGTDGVTAVGPVVLSTGAYQSIVGGKYSDNGQSINLGTNAKSYCSDASTTVRTAQDIVKLNHWR
ncbi:MAG: hypothetical protein MUD10_01090 [Candidatus Pacebacteria bacterium]|jgi:hypothetical protein|nr:hypothetical protein [Candidatus Paceibacterota bacterium]